MVQLLASRALIGLVPLAFAPGLIAGQTPARDSASAGSCAEGRIGTRRGHAMAYDPLSGGVVLFGGTSGDAKDPEPRSLWSWDGKRWRCLSSDGPPGRDAPELAFDAARRRLVLFGGRTRVADRQFRVLADTWEWDGAKWIQVDTLGAGARRLHQVLGYDPSRRSVLLHGGLDTDNRGKPLSDTWRWTGVRWEELSLENAPANPENHNALMMTDGGVMLLMQVKDSTRCPPTERWQRARAALYELRGSAWRELASDGPCVGGLPPTALTADGMVVVNGAAPGSPWPSEAWVWRGTEWRRVDSMPTSRRAARAAYDPARRRVVFFGGDDAAGMLGDTWEWDGRRWDLVRTR
jgi:hypothetical protein